MSLKWVCVSGYFDPLHIGHIEYFKSAKAIGDKLVVIVNSDAQAVLKKGKAFMPCAERCKIISELACVDRVVESIDIDRTVCATLASLEPKPSYFCNGGDQNNQTIPEGAICEQNGIELRDGFGAKIQSSSWLLGTASPPPKKLVLFDVDGTLTMPRKRVTEKTVEFLKELSKRVDIATVGGSDLKKQKEQMGDLSYFHYVFAENGLTGLKGMKVFHSQSLTLFIGEEKLCTLINSILGLLSQEVLPQKRGTFIEYRNGMLNVSPIGRACSQEERDAFEQWDRTSGCRKRLVETLSRRYPKMQFSIGGQISFDVFPKGWDKTYCLQFLEEYDEIHFFGDKTHKGGNDFEIYSDSRVVGHSVKTPEETIQICQKLFM